VTAIKFQINLCGVRGWVEPSPAPSETLLPSVGKLRWDWECGVHDDPRTGGQILPDVLDRPGTAVRPDEVLRGIAHFLHPNGNEPPEEVRGIVDVADRHGGGQHRRSVETPLRIAGHDV